ncbi:hypothetical protein VQ02_33605 [Methylobacterium variabile]|jgi:hypothetical protein|uniref:Uncharacterized protein n=1 Tax=Methylobacterium variabile TaxID=298794 RepID=A0A0J6UMG6_9HYPH|nr:hypothetical protein [Methylobacterium variabile]KMO27211.1 hypothetical protein VQ02_33605 [Methylobacterium variabile]
MTTMLRVGETWDLAPAGEGMTLQLVPAGDHASLTIIVSLRKPAASEIKALTKKPLQFGVTQSQVLTWVTLFGDQLSFDAPYASGIEKNSADIRASLSHVESWTDKTRNAATIVVTDPRNKEIKGVRLISLSKTWWSVFSRSVVAGPEVLSRETYDAAYMSDQRRYPTTQHLVRAAEIIESGGV